MVRPGGARALLLDIEGTTTPTSFVVDILAPYASERMSSFLTAYAEEPAVRAALAILRLEHASEPGPDKPPPWSAADPGRYPRWLIERDRKSGALKELQGRIWEDGYRTGLLVAPLFEDVPRAFTRWTQSGREVSIFSSGSVLAQRLLFANSTSGDQTRYLSAYFDTTTGPKRDPASYARIAAARGIRPGDFLFLSDVGEELDAAKQAGMQTGLCVRRGAREPSMPKHPVIRSFDDVP
jgi:enolase-phosphatase E1